MRLSTLFACGTVAAALVAPAAGAQAQDADPSARYDIDDVLGRHPHDVQELPSVEAARGRPVTVDLSLDGTYSTNAGASRFDPTDTGYVTPGLGVSVTPVSLGGWSVGAGALLDADFYTDDHDDDLGEGRLEGFVFAEHGLGPGTFTAEFILLGVFDNEFADQDFRLEISDLTYSVSSRGFTGEVSAEYQHSDVPELRRTRLTGMIGYQLPEPQLGYVMTIEGDVAFSDFDGGTNQNRNDTTAALVLIAERDLGRGWALEWEAAFVRRFSNRELSRFTALELGVEISKGF
jgi:hypothetical protein